MCIRDRANDASQGKHPTGVPKHMASVWTDYTIHGGDLNGLGFGGGVRYLGKTYGLSLIHIFQGNPH